MINIFKWTYNKTLICTHTQTIEQSSKHWSKTIVLMFSIHFLSSVKNSETSIYIEKTLRIVITVVQV